MEINLLTALCHIRGFLKYVEERVASQLMASFATCRAPAPGVHHAIYDIR